MNLEDLEPHERIAFAGMVRVMVRADGVLTPAESAALSRLAREVGSSRFWACMTEVQQVVRDNEDLTDAVRNVTRREVQEWIYEVLVGISAADGNMGEAEGHMLDWVRAVWSL